MNQTGYAMGRLNPVIYFVRASTGEILLPPGDRDMPAANVPTPKDCWRMEAGTLAEIDKLQKLMENQERAKCLQNIEHDETMLAARREKVRSNLTQRMISSSTTPYEREFIALYLQLRDEKKRERYRTKFMCDKAYFMAREMDDGGRGKIAQVVDRG